MTLERRSGRGRRQCRRLGTAALLVLGGFLLAEPALAQGGHGPSFGLATPTGGRGSNEGYADIHFGERNAVTLGSIRKAIRQSGFSGEGGDVVVRGTVDHANGQAVLTTPAGEVFLLAAGPGRAVGAADGPASAAMEAAGRVGKSADTRGQWVMRVERLEEAPPS